MGLTKYKGWQPDEPWAAENANSIDPDNIDQQAAGYLIGGTGHSALAVFQSLFSGANNGKIKINVDKQEYDDVPVDMRSQLFSTLAYVKNKFLGAPVRFSADGTKLFCNPTSSYGYYSPIVALLTTPFDIATASIWKYQTFQSYSYPTYFCISPDGTKLFWLAPQNSNAMNIYKTELSTPWDVTTFGAVTNVTLHYTGTGFSNFFMSHDGKHIYLPYYYSATTRLYKFKLNTAWDISTLDANGPIVYTVPTEFNGNSFYVTLNDDGSQITLLNNSRIAHRYNLSTPYIPDFSDLQSSATIPAGAYSNKNGVLMLGDKMMTSGQNGSNWYTEEYDFGQVVDLDDVAANLQAAIRLVTGGEEIAEYDTDHFKITSGLAGTSSQILKLMSPSSGTDISGNGATPYLDMADNATEVAGEGEDYNLVRLRQDGKISGDLVDTGIIIIASDNPVSSADTQRSTNSASYVKLKEITIQKSGRYRIYFGLKAGSSGYTSYGKIYKNDVALGSERTNTTTTFAYYSEDFDLVAGDKIQLYAHAVNTSYTAYVEKFRVMADLTFISMGSVDVD